MISEKSKDILLRHAPWLLIAAAVFAVYYPAVFATTTWDDRPILSSPQLRSWEGLATIWLRPDQSILDDYMPVNYTSNWLEYRVWGVNYAAIHADNILLHLLNALLLYYLLGRIGVRGGAAAVLLFAIHPVQISSVAWIAQRKDLLYTFFYFLAFLAWVRFEEKRCPGRYLAVLPFFLAALLSKRMAISWPLAAFLYSWWREGRFFDTRRVLRLAPLFFLALPVCFLPNLLSKRAEAASAPDTTGIFLSAEEKKLEAEIPATPLNAARKKCILAGKNLAYYTGKLLWPAEHYPITPRWTLDPRRPGDYLPFAAAGTVLLALWACAGHIGRGPFAAAAFYVVALFPVLGFVHWSLMEKTYVQDHYQYVAAIGPFLLAAHAAEVWLPRLTRRFPDPLLAARIAAGVLVLLPLALTAHRFVRLYQDNEKLFEPNFRKYPEAPDVAHNYTVGLWENHKVLKAREVCERALALTPRQPMCWQVQGMIQMGLQDYKGARDSLRKAAALCAGNAINESRYLNDLAKVYVYSDPPEPENAMVPLKRAIALNPQSAAPRATLGAALRLLGRKQEALAEFETCLRLDPWFSEKKPLTAYTQLLMENGEKSKALPLLQRIAPGN